MRAAALVRVARVQRAAGRSEGALAAHVEMATLGEVPVFERPRIWSVAWNPRESSPGMGRQDESRAAARGPCSTISTRDDGFWLVANLSPSSRTSRSWQACRRRPRQSSSLSAAATDPWNAWRAGTYARGSRLLRPEGVPVLVTLQSSGDRAAAWIVEPRDLLERLELDPGLAIKLTDAEGPSPGPDSTERAPRVACRHEVAMDDASDPDGRARRRRRAPRALVISGLVLMLVFLGAGAFFIGRAIRHETELARLQSDFVSAVSHEFRTPLAAMRQFSELLADGRVPSDEKRQHYYESLAGESRRLQRLVENLLNFSRLEAGAKPYQADRSISRRSFTKSSPSSVRSCPGRSVKSRWREPRTLRH